MTYKYAKLKANFSSVQKKDKKITTKFAHSNLRNGQGNFL